MARLRSPSRAASTVSSVTADVPADQLGEGRAGGRARSRPADARHRRPRRSTRPPRRRRTSGTWPVFGMLTGSSRAMPVTSESMTGAGQLARLPGLELLGPGQPGVDVGDVPVLVLLPPGDGGELDVVVADPIPTPR